MQMFVLDPDPKIAARNLSDVHVRVICREVTMLLSSWYWWNVPEMRPCLPYSPMCENQPLAKQMSSIPVRRWAFDFAGAVFEEFRFRFGKTHASEERYMKLKAAIAGFDSGMNIGIKAVRFTFVAKGDGVFAGKTMSQAVRLYRLYYKYKVENMAVPAVYTNRDWPDWLD